MHRQAGAGRTKQPKTPITAPEPSQFWPLSSTLPCFQKRATGDLRRPDWRLFRSTRDNCFIITLCTFIFCVLRSQHHELTAIAGRPSPARWNPPRSEMDCAQSVQSKKSSWTPNQPFRPTAPVSCRWLSGAF